MIAQDSRRDASSAGLGSRSYGVLEGDDPRWIHMVPSEPKVGLLRGSWKERNAATQQHRDDRDLDSIYKAGLEESAKQFAAAE